MASYFLKRVLLAVALLFIASIVSFIIIQLPPGDYLTTYINQLKASGQDVDRERIDNATAIWAGSAHVRVLVVDKRFSMGDFGFAFQQNRRLRLDW
jgi:peptide/nickel transport system permease protein